MSLSAAHRNVGDLLYDVLWARLPLRSNEEGKILEAADFLIKEARKLQQRYYLTTNLQEYDTNLIEVRFLRRVQESKNGRDRVSPQQNQTAVVELALVHQSLLWGSVTEIRKTALQLCPAMS
jgi:uncharacterized protein (DUF2267 family)